jgi:hypothetical protein
MLTEGEDTGNNKRTHQIALCGELTLEEAVDLPKTGYRINESVSQSGTTYTKRMLPFVKRESSHPQTSTLRGSCPVERLYTILGTTIHMCWRAAYALF